MLEEGKHYPAMNGKQVFRWATEKMPEVVREVLGRRRGHGADAIDLFVPHQANLRINQLVGQKLGIPESKTVHNIEQLRQHHRRDDPARPQRARGAEGRCDGGSNVLFAAFGSGYTWGGAVVTL